MAGMNGQGMGAVGGGGGGSATQGGTTGATTNALVKATAANTLSDSGLINVSGGAITTGIDTDISATAGTVSAGTTGRSITLTASAAKAGSGANGGGIALITGAGDGAGVKGAISIEGSGATYPCLRGISDVLYILKGDRTGVGGLEVGAIACSATTITGSATSTGGNFTLTDSTKQFIFAPSGTPDAGLKRSAAGVVAVTDGSTGIGAFLAKDVISAKTADYGVLAADTGTIFTNTGASGTVIFTLPAAPANGLVYEFHITAAQTVDIQTGTAVLIYANAAATTATTGKLSKNTVGTTIRLTYNSVAWMGPNQSGTWTVS